MCSSDLDYRGKTPVLGTMEEKMEELARELRREIKANRGSSDLVRTHDLCLVPRVDVPKKFKVPEFDRYNGLTCPQNHIIKYVRKMANYVDNDSLMIHCFQDSLMEDAAEWYTGLSKDDIRTFDDLATAFKNHYGFNTGSNRIESSSGLFLRKRTKVFANTHKGEGTFAGEIGAIPS